MSPGLSNRFDLPLALELRPSPFLWRALFALHAAALAGWLLSPVPAVARLMALPVLAFSLLSLGRRHARPSSARAVIGLYWEQETGWHVRMRGGWQAAELCLPCYVTATLAVARFRVGRWRRVAAIVVPDRVDADAFRRLRVRLLQCAAHAGKRAR